MHIPLSDILPVLVLYNMIDISLGLNLLHDTSCHHEILKKSSGSDK